MLGSARRRWAVRARSQIPRAIILALTSGNRFCIQVYSAGITVLLLTCAENGYMWTLCRVTEVGTSDA